MTELNIVQFIVYIIVQGCQLSSNERETRFFFFKFRWVRTQNVTRSVNAPI